MPRHRFGREDYKKARENLAVRTNEANVQAARADMSLMNGGSLADAVVLAAQGAQRQVNQGDLDEQLLNQSGENLGALGPYAVTNLIFNKLLPPGVYANEMMTFNDHILLENFDEDRVKIGQKYVEIDLANRFAQPSSLTDPGDIGVDVGVPTPDKLNKLAGLITLDPRVMAQLSIAASLVVQNILKRVPSSEISDPTSHYKTKRVVFVEDLIEYIHSNFSQNVTLDPETGDAFERLTEGELTDFTRALLLRFKKATKDVVGSKGRDDGSVYFEQYENERGRAHWRIGQKPSVFADIYADRLNAICTVTKEGVGKVWQSKTPSDGVKSLFEATISQRPTSTVQGKTVSAIPYNTIWMSMAVLLRGTPNMEFGTRFNLGRPQENGIPINSDLPKLYDPVFDVACSAMSLIALHVISYSLSYSIDAYVRLAIRGAERQTDGTILFGKNNVITPQVIFPGIKAALGLYGVSTERWDEEMAFHLRTNQSLMQVFLLAKKAYDLDKTKPGVKRFSNPVAEDPYWTRDRTSQSARQAEWEDINVRSGEESMDIADQNMYRDAKERMTAYTAKDAASDLAKSVVDYRRIGSQSAALKDRVGSLVTANFGRRRRRGNSFGKKRRGGSKKRRSSKKLNSFGKKKRRSSKKLNSFGKKKRHSSKKRRHSKKH